MADFGLKPLIIEDLVVPPGLSTQLETDQIVGYFKRFYSSIAVSAAP